MQVGLTELQRLTLMYIKEYSAKMKYSPSVRDIGEHFGRTPKSIQDRLMALVKKGYISHTPKVARSIVILKED